MAVPTTMTSIPGAGAPPTVAAWEAAFARALPYAEFLAAHATPDQRARWDAVQSRVVLTPPQQRLLSGFVRRMPVLVLAGAWCGDCVSQCPIFARFAEAHLRVCGGQRVPVAAFFSEDFSPVVFYGDRTLSAYRAAAATQAGAACATGISKPDSDGQAATISDWLDQFERVHLILRLSARLREKHGD